MSPRANLNESTKYYVVVSNGITDLSGNATSLSVSPTITIDFSEPILNVSSSTVSLHLGSPTRATIATVALTSGEGDTYSFSPSASLNKFTTYYVVLSSSITNVAGNALVQPGNLLFMTVFATSTQFLNSGQDGIINNINLTAHSYTNLRSLTPFMGAVTQTSSGALIATIANGVIITSSDDGLTWTSQSSGVSLGINKVAENLSGVLVAVGDSGTILTSSDNGHTWVPQNSGINELLTSVATNSLDYLTMIAVGFNGRVLRSIDNGVTWNSVSPYTQSPPLIADVAFDSANGFFCSWHVWHNAIFSR